MSSLDYAGSNVPLATDADGTVRVRGSRLVFDLIVRAYWNGATPEDMARIYETLDPADAYLIVGFYLKNRPMCDEFLRERERSAAGTQAQWEAASKLPTNVSRLPIQFSIGVNLAFSAFL